MSNLHRSSYKSRQYVFVSKQNLLIFSEENRSGFNVRKWGESSSLQPLAPLRVEAVLRAGCRARRHRGLCQNFSSVKGKTFGLGRS